jgi:hypothetical protein
VSRVIRVKDEIRLGFVIWYGLNIEFFSFWSMDFVTLNKRNNSSLDLFFYFGQLFFYGIEVGIGEVVMLDNMFCVRGDIITWVFVKGNIYSLTIMWDFEVS